jgi:hypothetical protein
VAAPAATGTFPALPKAERGDPLADSPFGGDTTSAPVVRALPVRDRSSEASDDDLDFSPRKGKSKKLVVGISAAALLLVAGIVGLVMSGGDHPNPAAAAPVAVAPPVERATPPEEPAAPQPAAVQPEPVKPATASGSPTPKAQPAEPGAPTLSSSWASKFAVPAPKK